MHQSYSLTGNYVKSEGGHTFQNQLFDFGQSMDLQGVHDILHCANKNVSHIEVVNDFDLVAEDFQQEARDSVSDSDENGSIPNRQETLAGTIAEVSVEVAKTTDVAYRHIMKRFDIWLRQHHFILESETIFQENLAENTPLLIIAFIMSECDFKNPDGFQKPKGTDPPKTFSHAMKLRSALTYGFGRHYRRGTPWSQNLATQRWEGNPSVSVPVSRYMLSLRKRKHVAGDQYGMSSRALTSDVIRQLHLFNNSEGRSDVDFQPVNTTGETQWGNPRRRLLVHSVLTLAFVCLLRIDEVLNLQFQDIRYHGPDHIEVTLQTRKTHQFSGSKPYHLWPLRTEDRELCPVSALSRWITASCLGYSPTGYIFRSVGVDGKAPSIFKNHPITAPAFIELFRNNLIDIGMEPTMYGHSCRRGGCQWFIREKPDDPYESREDYLNSNRPANTPCSACGRRCWCGY